jgi:hypothetical protein
MKALDDKVQPLVFREFGNWRQGEGAGSVAG